MRLSRILLASFAILAIAGPASAQDAQVRLWNASIAGDTAAIRLAVQDGARVDALDRRTNQNGRYALNWAAWHDRADAVKLLLALGASIEAENITGFTALHHAAENGSLAALDVLLEAGADPDHPNADGRMPAETARGLGRDEAAKRLDAAPRKKRD